MTAPNWREWPDSKKRALLEALREKQHQAIRSRWEPYPWQVPPDEVPAQGTWLMLGGRGTGKTDGCARYMDEHVAGPPCDPRAPGGHRMAIVAPTMGDAAESCVLGLSGLKAHNPRVELKSSPGGLKAVWPSGAEARLMGAYTPEDVERLRAAGNRCLIWLEEVAAMRRLDDVLEHTGYGLRVGPRPHYIASTTPKPRPAIKTLVNDEHTIVTRGKTQDAHHLDPAVRERLYKKYLGTRRGRQELEGVLLEDVEGALWTWAMLDGGRVRSAPPGMKVVVAIDPAASNTEDSDETGIIVAGLHQPERTGGERGPLPAPHGYVLDDRSGRYAPEEWGKIALDLAERWEADYLVAERNQGGDMVGHVLRSIDRTARYRDVTATRGKRLRAEPVSVLYEQGRVHHVGAFPELEEQLTTWTPEDDDSPDRLDALVWALTDLMVTTRRGGRASAA